MSDQVWEGSRVNDEIGGPIGEGYAVNQAFSVDVVLRNGLGFVQEAPLFALGGGALLMLAQLGPSLLSIPFSVAGSVGQSLGTDEGQLAYLVTQLVQLSITLLAQPFIQLFYAGLVVCAARHATGEPPRFLDLVTAVGPAIRGFLYSFVVGLISLAATAIASVPFAALFGAAIYLGSQHTISSDVVLVSSLALMLVWVVVVLALSIYLGMGLLVGYYGAIVDNKWPVEAIAYSWRASDGARITLFITMLVVGVANAIAYFSIYCLLGLVLLPIVLAVVNGGFAISWLLHARPEATTREWAFFQRNPPPFM